LSKSSPNLTNRRPCAYTRGCQVLPIARRCLRLVRQLKLILRDLEYAQRHCSECQELSDEDDPSEPCFEFENQMANLDTAIGELQEQWDACHWDSDHLTDPVDFIDEKDLMSSGE
jgi:hypothetical protein